MFSDLFVDSLTIVKPLLLFSSLLKIIIPALAFNCSYATSVINKIQDPLTVCGFHLNLLISLTFCGIRLQLRNLEQLAISACYGFRDTTNVPTNFTLKLFVRGIHGNFRTCFWNPRTYGHTIVRLSRAHFGLVMFIMFDPIWKNMISYGWYVVKCYKMVCFDKIVFLFFNLLQLLVVANSWRFKRTFPFWAALHDLQKLLSQITIFLGNSLVVNVNVAIFLKICEKATNIR